MWAPLIKAYPRINIFNWRHTLAFITCTPYVYNLYHNMQVSHKCGVYILSESRGGSMHFGA